jgi:hypothetical protein
MHRHQPAGAASLCAGLNTHFCRLLLQNTRLPAGRETSDALVGGYSSVVLGSVPR